MLMRKKANFVGVLEDLSVYISHSILLFISAPNLYVNLVLKVLLSSVTSPKIKGLTWQDPAWRINGDHR